MESSLTCLENGVILAELGGHGDGAYCAKHGLGGAMVMLGSYIVDPGDDVDYPAPFVFKPGATNYADYLRQHIAKAKESKAKVAVSVCATDLQDNVDFLKTAEDAGADYVSYCAHSTMEMFVSKNQSSMFCNKANWGTLEKWASAIVKAVSVPVIFKIGIHGTDEEIVGTTEILSQSGVRMVHMNICDLSTRIARPEIIPALQGKCEFLIAGGGIKTLEDAQRMLSSGADAVAIGKAAMENPELIGKIQNGLRN